MQTIRLFDQDSHLYSFTTRVLSAEEGKTPDTLLVTLEATAFFPEGGGQYPDKGDLAGYPVVDVQTQGGIITHTVQLPPSGHLPHPFLEGAMVRGEVDAALRFVRMQNHTGEHIVSGIIHRLYGYRNVGFHLGETDVTLDLDGVLTHAQIQTIEEEANAIVFSNLPVTAYYPSPAELSTLSYRAKLDLSEGVRLVRIGSEEDVRDLCACCAPHVTRTGEIGLIKLLEHHHYKGGVRIHMRCGSWALADYRRHYTAVTTISTVMSVKQEEVAEGFTRLCRELDKKKQTIASLRAKLEELTVAALPYTKGNLCLFDEGLEALEMRRLLGRATQRCEGICGIFSGNDTEGYRFVIGRGRDDLDLKGLIPHIKTALSAKGGGSSEMLQGSCTATQASIRAFFEE